jgi:hypothetical protein
VELALIHVEEPLSTPASYRAGRSMSSRTDIPRMPRTARQLANQWLQSKEPWFNLEASAANDPHPKGCANAERRLRVIWLACDPGRPPMGLLQTHDPPASHSPNANIGISGAIGRRAIVRMRRDVSSNCSSSRSQVTVLNRSEEHIRIPAATSSPRRSSSRVECFQSGR